MKYDRLHLMTKICYFYYNEGLTQSEIAAKLNISRQMASRLLQKAKEEGIVEIYIKSPVVNIADLEVKIEKKFGLKEAIVIQNNQISGEELKAKLGNAAAAYLEHQLTQGLKIGVGWGTTLRYMAEHFNKLNVFPLKDIKVYQLIGGINNVEYHILAQDIVALISSSLGAKDYYIHAPCIVANEEVCDTIMSEGVIREVLKQFNGIDYAFLGIGTLEDPIISRFLQPEEIENLRELGAVGQICLRYFDNQGQFLTGALNKRVISVSVEQLSQMKNVVALAGGSDKFDAVLGILKSGLLDVLVTDEETARFVLEN
ncbi:MAG: hypothetical protein CVU89_02840 [Firmicutes bacterium HGW-Firmicutes-14]|nr:MAG: hypothetical protein CVU89_02840 [Firmicutes bacterium HGW-Firmicutes-14]